MIDTLPHARPRRFAPGLGLLCCLTLLVGATNVTQTTRASPISWASDKFLDANCNGQANAGAPEESRASQMLLMLKCDVAPLYDQFVAKYHEGKQPDVIGDNQVIGRDLRQLRRVIGEFVDEAQVVLNLRDFCTFSTFSRLARLKASVGDSRLLSLAYDLVAIELHTTCLEQTISNLPPVPHLVKDIVKIYLDGADKRVPDLNSPHSGSIDMDDDTPFDLEAAIKKNGSLEQVVGLSLGLWGTDSDTASEFRKTCKDLLISIEQRWGTMEMMNTMVATDGSAIKQVNNYALRTLAPTKFADVCSKVSASN